MPRSREVSRTLREAIAADAIRRRDARDARRGADLAAFSLPRGAAIEKRGGSTTQRSRTRHRLSYFLWSSMPDDALLDLAAKGMLKQPRSLAAQVERLLADAKSQRFVEQFTTQWLDLGGMERVAVNPQYYPRFKDELKAYMAGETKAFFGEILRSGSSALQFLDSDWTMINAPLSKHYRLKVRSRRPSTASRSRAPSPRRPARPCLDALINSNGEDSNPIKRAVWIRERLLHDPPLPPPPNVPACPSRIRTLRSFPSVSKWRFIARTRPAPIAIVVSTLGASPLIITMPSASGAMSSAVPRKRGHKGHPVFDRTSR